MLERTRVPYGGERFQRDILVVPLKKEPIRSAALPKYGKASAASTNLFHRSSGYNPKTVIAGLEKRRAELFALALEAVARAKEARERCVRAENKLEQETNQRLVAEQRLRDIEQVRLRQLQAMIKVAENDARSLTLALARADQKRAEAEASARAAKEKAHQIESFYLGGEAAGRHTRERDLKFGLLIFENKRHEMSGMECGLPDHAPIAEDEFTSFNLMKPVDDEHTDRVTKQKELRIKPKFIVYSTVIMSLLVGVCWLLSGASL
jgi:hypothetical protein